MLNDLLDALRSTSVRPYLDKLQTFLAANPDLQAVVRDAGKILTGLAEPTGAPVAPPQSVEAPAVTVPPAATPAPAVERPATARPTAGVSYPHLPSGPTRTVVRREASESSVVWPPPSYADAAPAPPPPTRELAFEPASNEDLPQIAERTRLKAEATRWAAERQRRLAAGEAYGGELEQKRLELVARARAIPRCLLWMCRQEFTAEYPSWYEDLSGSFDAVGDLSELLSEMTAEPEQPEGFADTLRLAAEAQSALKVAVESLNPGRPDWDQLRLYHWLRSAVAERHIWVDRHMKADDPADPANWKDLRLRIQEVKEAFHNVKGKDKRRKRGLNKVRYLFKQMEDNPEVDRVEQWTAVVQTATELVQAGLPPSNAELREALLPSLDDLPDEVEATKEFALVLREIDRYLDSRTPAVDVNAGATRMSAEVEKAAELLEGKSAILIGGVKRPEAAEAIEDAFGLKELIWIEGRDQSYFDFEPDVSREDVAVVLLAIRWSRHGFSGVKTFCDRYGKALVHLPTGYNPNQIAHQILTQAGDRL